MVAVAVLLFVLGCVFGSFLTVVAARLPRGEPWVGGRSRCPNCKAEIGARDNVPVVSWVLLRGRCRACGEPISARYPLTEVALGALWAATYLILGSDDGGKLALGLVLCALLVLITLTDLELRVIPNVIVGFGAVVGIAIVAGTDIDSLPENLIAAAIAGAVLLVVALAYPRGMGMGDVKLVAMMGVYLGRAVAPALLIGLLAGALVGAVMIARRGVGGAQAGDPVRAVPGPRRRDRDLVR